MQADMSHCLANILQGPFSKGLEIAGTEQLHLKLLCISCSFELNKSKNKNNNDKRLTETYL